MRRLRFRNMGQNSKYSVSLGLEVIFEKEGNDKIFILDEWGEIEISVVKLIIFLKVQGVGMYYNIFCIF